MQAQQQKLDAVSNDLANANTNGYKRLRTSGSRTSCTSAAAGRRRPTTRSSAPARASCSNGRTFEQGNLRETGDPLNVGIEGEGFIKVKLSDGRQALTRDGDLHIDGRAASSPASAAFVQPQITIPKGVGPSQISIGQDGTVTAAGQNVGKIALATVRSPHEPRVRRRTNAFVTTPRVRQRDRRARRDRLKQGTLEASNTDVSARR